jgi:TonB family protein
MSCPDPYRPYNPFEDATPDAELKLQNALPSDADIRGLTSALAASGGGSASEDLALDLVLNQIVEQACLATGATGAAIALTRNGEMVCRATTGRTAPDLGVRLDNAGFSAECLRIGTLQRCDDTETDPRVDSAACRLLGVRSILVVPLWYWGEFVGIFEIFSPRPNAFGERDEQTLQALAYRIVRHTKTAGGQITGFAAKPEEFADATAPAAVTKPEPKRVEPMPPPTSAFEPEPEPEPVRERQRTPVYEFKSNPASKSSSSSDRTTTWLAVCAGVIACLIIGLMAWRVGATRNSAQKSAQDAQSPQPQELDLGPVTASAAPATPEEPKSARPQGSKTQSEAAASDVVISAASKSASKTNPAAGAQPNGQETGGLAIYDEKGKLIYGKPVHPDEPSTPAKTPAKPRAATTPPASGSELPSSAKSSSTSAASSVKSASQITRLPLDSQSAINDGFVRLKPETAESLLDQRVEPEYPEAARRAHIQGSVVLETLIGANGRVQQLSAVSGNPDLADAAIAAVRQWRYKPFTVDGKKVPIRTQVNVTFMQAQ